MYTHATLNIDCIYTLSTFMYKLHLCTDTTSGVSMEKLIRGFFTTVIPWTATGCKGHR